MIFVQLDVVYNTNLLNADVVNLAESFMEPFLLGSIKMRLKSGGM